MLTVCIICHLEKQPNASARILVVDDDSEICNLLSEYLSSRGYDVACADSGEAMRAAIARAVPAVVLLDIGLPGEDGLALARYLRERLTCGIVMITGAHAVVDRVVGLEVGADDYIAKPFDLREVLARVRSVLRRVAPRDSQPAEERVPVGKCVLDLRSHQLSEAGREVSLTAMEFDLLKALVNHPNQVLSRDQLLSLTRQREWEPFDRSIDILVARLRRKVEADPDRPSAIRTVRGAGYMFVNDVYKK